MLSANGANQLTLSTYSTTSRSTRVRRFARPVKTTCEAMAASGGKALSLAVVGSGVIGLSVALGLQRAGHHVTLLDRAGGVACPQHSTSYGHAGTFATYANVPVNRPGIVWDLPQLLSATGPLSIKPTPHLLRMAPWFAHFLRNCNADAVEHTALSLGMLLSRAQPAYNAIWEQAAMDVDGPMGKYSTSGHGDLSFSCRQGYLILQKSAAAMAASQAGAALRRRGVAGLRMEALSPEEVMGLEPNLVPSAAAGGAWWFPDGWFVRDPAAVLLALADGFAGAGGELRTGADGDVSSIAPGPRGDGVRLALSGGGSMDADQVCAPAP
mmetsp:Transcript_22328/g.58189  ORF Transcript_22328/g.58189 Transcript_22328/m.58189 type:complete len:325 (-) Transcript_22328:168-1142(-)